LREVPAQFWIEIEIEKVEQLLTNNSNGEGVGGATGAGGAGEGVGTTGFEATLPWSFRKRWRSLWASRFSFSLTTPRTLPADTEGASTNEATKRTATFLRIIMEFYFSPVQKANAYLLTSLCM